MTTLENDVARPRPDLTKPKHSSTNGSLRGLDSAPVPALRRVARNGSAPLSFAQQRLWFLDQLQPNSSLYNLPMAVRLSGLINSEALRKAINAIAHRHEILRTRFVNEVAAPVQVISEKITIELPTVDLTSHPESQREEMLQQLLRQETGRSFDLSSDLLLRVLLVQLASDEHVLLVNMHHIISDAWSFDVLLGELAELYQAFKTGGSFSLEELPIQYADYAAWQREWMSAGVLQKQMGYWKKQLAGAPFLLELPADKSRPEVQTFRGGQATRELPHTLAAALRQFSRKQGGTLFMTLLAAFKVFLLRYTNQTDLVIGSPIAGRNRMETEKLIGFFVNTLALRTDLSGNPTFAEVLARVRQVTLDAYEHQDLPFERLVEELRPARNPGYNPLIQIMFVYQPEAACALELSGLTVTPLALDTSTSKFDLTLVVRDDADGLSAVMEYSTDLFVPETIARMLEHFQILLEGIMAAPEKNIGELPLLSATERHQVIVGWNDTHTNYPRDKTVPELFAAQASASPAAVAVDFGGRQLTYRELDDRSNQLAGQLRRLGVKPETVVGVCMERSLELIVGLLGILKAGGAYASFDPSQPADRLALMFDDCQPKVWLTQKKFERVCPLRANCATLCLDGDWKNSAQKNGHDSSSGEKLSATNLAYVSFTSGSTGKPKGVGVTHRGIARLVRETNYAQFRADDIFLQFAPIAFDASTFEIWGALLNGARLVVFPPQIPSLAELGSFIKEQRITTLWLTAGLFHQMVEEQLGSLGGVRQLLAGGDVLSVPHVRKALARLKNCQLINGYGPTENTTFTCCHKITEASETSRSISIGRPISNTQVYILNQQLQPAPIGVPGELHAGGDGLACGYLNRPEITAEKFIPDPFAAKSGAKLYKTGDLARWLPNGDIEFLGRLDSQVKIRGYRVELGEIETILNEHPRVQESAVTTHVGQFGEKQIIAYVVADGAPLGTEELRRYLTGKLPDYMMPAAFVSSDALPLNANGKVDRHALPVPEMTNGAARKFVAPRTLDETRLATIWEDVLGVRPVGAEDHFFDLGGHSLMAVRLVAQIEKVFGKKIPVTTIFQLPTVARLAGALGEGRLPAQYSSLVEIQPRGSRPPLVLVHGAGGGMFWGYTNLSHCLGLEQPVYAFKSRGMDGQEEFGTIEEMAAHYIAELRVLQPEGPYYLGGYCFGGNVAYEMARQLKAQGQKTALLALINCAPRGSSYERIKVTPDFCVRFLGNLGYWTSYVLRLKPKQQLHLLLWKCRAIVKRISRIFSGRSRNDSSIEVDELVDLSDQPPERRKLWNAHIQALVKHQTQFWTGHVTLYRTRGHSLLCSFDYAYGWRDFARGVDVKVVPGAHESILDERHAPHLAKILERRLNELQTDSRKGNGR